MNLIVQNISKSFAGVNVLSGLNLEFEAGKVTALIGPNGAGKTTLFNVISGFIKPNQGLVELISGNGQRTKLTGLMPQNIALKGIGRLFQDVRTFKKLTLLENLMTAAPGQTGEDPLKAVFRPQAVKSEEAVSEKRAMELLSFVGLEEFPHKPAETLSYGQQKLLAIARLMAGNSSVFLLDEPTSGVHPEMMEKLLSVIRALAQEGKTVVVIEHNMNVVLKVSDWVFLLDDGQVAYFGMAQEVLNSNELKEAYLGV